MKVKFNKYPTQWASLDALKKIVEINDYKVRVRTTEAKDDIKRYFKLVRVPKNGFRKTITHMNVWLMCSIIRQYFPQAHLTSRSSTHITFAEW